MPSNRTSDAITAGSFAAVALTLATPGAVQPALAETPCDDAAEVFVETGRFDQLEVSTALHLVGPSGAGDLSFISGTSQQSIIQVINTLVGTTGINAGQSAENPQRIQLASILAGGDAFVSVTQIGGDEPLLFALSSGGEGSWRMIAHGNDGLSGDANCDARVDIADLISVITHWGSCPRPPATCIGDVNLSGAVDVNDLITVILNWT